MPSPESVHSTDIYASFPLLTEVPLPKTLDMRDTLAVTHLLSQLVNEKIASEHHQNRYLGSILYGSLSRGIANNDSDLDICHIAENSDITIVFPVIHKLQVIFKHLYEGDGGMDATRLFLPPVGLEELRVASSTELEKIRTGLAFGLDQNSLTIIPDSKIRKEVEDLLDFRSRPIRIYQRPFPRLSHEITPPRQLKLGLLRQISDNPVAFHDYWDWYQSKFLYTP